MWLVAHRHWPIWDQILSSSLESTNFGQAQGTLFTEGLITNDLDWAASLPVHPERKPQIYNYCQWKQPQPHLLVVIWANTKLFLPRAIMTKPQTNSFILIFKGNNNFLPSMFYPQSTSALSMDTSSNNGRPLSRWWSSRTPASTRFIACKWYISTKQILISSLQSSGNNSWNWSMNLDYSTKAKLEADQVAKHNS